MEKIVRSLASRIVFPALIATVASCGGEGMEEEMSPAPDAADVEITPFGSAGVQVVFDGTVIHVDPWSQGDYTNAQPADLILITDTPGDHLDPDLIQQLRKPGATVVLPSTPEDARDEGSAERLLRVPDGLVMNNGETMTLAGVHVEAVPMYDVLPAIRSTRKARATDTSSPSAVSESTSLASRSVLPKSRPSKTSTLPSCR